jgi:hypothetical protein
MFVKLTLYVLVGPEEYDRISQMSFLDRAEEVGGQYHVLFGRGVDEFTLPSGQKIRVGMNLWETGSDRTDSVITRIVPNGDGTASIQLGFGWFAYPKIFQNVRSYDDVLRK